MTFKNHTKIKWVKCDGCGEFLESGQSCQKCYREIQWNQISGMTYRELCAQDDQDYYDRHYGY